MDHNNNNIKKLIFARLTAIMYGKYDSHLQCFNYPILNGKVWKPT